MAPMLEPDEGLSPAHEEDTGPTASGKWGRRAHGQLEVRKPTWFESWDSQAPCVVWLVGGREGGQVQERRPLLPALGSGVFTPLGVFVSARSRVSFLHVWLQTGFPISYFPFPLSLSPAPRSLCSQLAGWPNPQACEGRVQSFRNPQRHFTENKYN